MIYEFRIDEVKPGSLAEVEKRFGEAYEYRKTLSPLAAFWHTEIGRLNQIIHVWPYKDLEERAKIRAAAIASGQWPPKVAEFITAQRSEIFVRAEFSPEITPRTIGPYFEMRTYTYQAEALHNVLENWGRAVPERVKVSPLCFCGHSEFGGLNKWMHIWAYPTLDKRKEVRDQTAAAGIWPPAVVARKVGGTTIPYVAQENCIVMPAKFSPVQ